MPIAHFGPAQADIYLPAVIALAVAALAAAVVLVAWPALRGARGVVVRILCGAVILGAVGVAVAVAVPAQRTLADQVPSVQQQIDTRYGLRLPATIVGRLIDGDTLSAKDVRTYTGASEPIHLQRSHGLYELVRTESTANATSEFPQK